MPNLTKKRSNYHVIGMMSGTSLDGLDIAFCEFSLDNYNWSYTIQEAETISYPKNLTKKLSDATELSGEELLKLDVELGKWFGDKTMEFISRHHIQVDFVSSHGHTVFHQPQNGFTTQIGAGFHLNQAVKVPVICDFRSKDVSLGGQGAPLVPIGDQLLFKGYDFCLNLGGISNISFEKYGVRKAFDIGPCNMLLNYLAQQKGLEYDKEGRLAASGSLNKPLLSSLNKWRFYKNEGPKSLGYEQVRDEIYPLLDMPISVEDKLCTISHHIAFQISQVIKYTNKRLLVTGGGAHNSFLIKLLKKYADDAEIISPNRLIIDFKEALLFGFLGVLKVRGEVNTLASVTGASEDSCGGVIYG